MRATTLGHGIMATGTTNNKMTDGLGAATNYCMTPLGDQEAMMKATTRPCCVGLLAKHHRAHSTATTGTITPRHTIPQHGHKTMATATLGHAPQDGVTCKQSELGSLPQAHDPSVGRTFLFVCDLALDSI